jgi:hypothetical protein
MSSVSNKYLGIGVIVFFIFTVGWSLGMMLPSINKFAKANDSREMMDLSPKNSPAAVYEYMDKTTPEGREELKTIYSFEDFVFPMAYGPFILLTLLFFHKKAMGRKKMFWICFVVPVVMVTCDYLENFSILQVIENYPNKIAVAERIGMFTSLKWAMGLSSALILGTMLWVLRLKIKFKDTEKTA